MTEELNGDWRLRHGGRSSATPGGWDHRERLSEFVPTEGNEGSQGIVLRLKIWPPLSSLSHVKTLPESPEARTFR